jgi:hypothetical protein
MVRKLTILGFGAASLLASGTASAQAAAGAFGDQGQFIISADRVMPLFAYENEKHTNTNGSTDSNTVTSIALVTHGPTFVTIYNVPRFAFDYTVWQHLTVGGSVWAYFQLGNSNTHSEPGMPDMSNDQPKITFWGLSPRVGWILHLSDLFAFWPRGGISFDQAITSFNQRVGMVTVSGTNTVTQWAIDLEPMFAITPVPHAAFTVGPVVDIPFSGSSSNSSGGTTVSTDQTQFHFGIVGGLLAWF